MVRKDMRKGSRNTKFAHKGRETLNRKIDS
nr:MAG TPA: hypothetical protein [Caudoviricetes sp.]